MGHRFLEHTTDAIVEVHASTIAEAFVDAGNAVIETTLDPRRVCQLQTRKFTAGGKDLRYLLFSWLEEITYVLITEGFAIRKLEPRITERADGYAITCTAHGEPMDVEKHRFRVEIKAPTFHDMVIRTGRQTYMRFLLDL